MLEHIKELDKFPEYKQYKVKDSDVTWTKLLFDKLKVGGLWTTSWYSVKVNQDKKECMLLDINKKLGAETVCNVAVMKKVLDHMGWSLVPPNMEGHFEYAMTIGNKEQRDLMFGFANNNVLFVTNE